MSATTNFIQADTSAANVAPDSTYYTHTFVTSGGVPNGVCPTVDFNKCILQVSTMVSALALALVNKGYSPNDGTGTTSAATPSSAVTTLAAVLANIRTNADSLYTFSTVTSSGTVPSGNPWLVESLTMPSLTRTLWTVTGNALYSLSNLGGGTQTLNPAAGQFINGLTTISVTNAILLASNGSSWVILAQF